MFSSRLLSLSILIRATLLLALFSSLASAQGAVEVDGGGPVVDAAATQPQPPPAATPVAPEVDAQTPSTSAQPSTERDAGQNFAQEDSGIGASDATADSALEIVAPSSGQTLQAHQAEPTNKPSASAPGAASPIEVRAVARRTRAGLDRSSNAVTVVDLQRAKLESSDLAAVLARTEGINVQRTGGLGSRARFSLAGFEEHQVRFFIDGVPLEFAGYSFGLQNVPVNFARRVDVHKGVVPVRLGADALGGAFDLITDRSSSGTRGMASAGIGSFGTYRFNGGLRHRDAATGLFAKAEAFFDKADNDYPVQVMVSDRTGVPKETTVYRFNDVYKAGGGNLEAGFVDKPWARRLLARTFITDYYKELPHNVNMTAPWGEAHSGGRSWGASLRYENDFARGTSVSNVGGYAYQRADLYDKTECSYDWFGQCRLDIRIIPAEIGSRESDRTIRDQSGFLRMTIEQVLHPNHTIRLATAPTYTKRTGNDRFVGDFDPYKNPKRLFKWISGIEYEATALEDALQNVFFAKSYFQDARHTELTALERFKRNERRVLWGVGDGLRYNILPWLFAKASYEYATRLPDPRELFGDGQVIVENLALKPERSHNVNASLAVSDLRTLIGTVDGVVTAFYRDASDLMVLLPIDQVLRYENIYDARVTGVEGSFTWVSPGEYVELGGNLTYQNAITESRDARLGKFRGDRIPNRPYLWANGRVRLQKRAAVTDNDELSLTWHTRYVHSFYLNWEGAGRKGPEDAVPDQFVHSIVLSYLVKRANERQISFTSEVQNLTDERTFDFYGVQRPGRAVFCKATLVY